MFKKPIVLLSLLSFLISCQEDRVSNDFYKKSYNRWSAGTKVSWINPHFENQEKITEPENTTQALLEVEFLDKTFSKVSDCLYFSIPKKSEGGVLFFVANPERKPCSELILGDRFSEIKRIINFGFEVHEEELLLKIDEKRFTYKLLNYLKKKDFKTLSTSEEKVSLITSDIDYNIKKKILNNGDTCFEVDDECNIIKENECDSCVGGHYQIINNKCRSLQTKVCGINNCGLKNQVACLRGYTSSGIKPENYCVNSSPLGFCDEGLNIVCENGILICE